MKKGSLCLFEGKGRETGAPGKRVEVREVGCSGFFLSC